MTLLIATALGAYRLAYLIAYEDGPWFAAVRFRQWLIGRYGAQSWIATGVHCPLCISFWLVWPLTYLPTLPQAALGAAGAALITHRLLEAADAAAQP